MSGDVLALHGFTGTGEDYRPLSAGWPDAVTAIDLPGHGLAPAPRAPADYALPAQAATLVPLIADLARPLLLWGYSYGGRLALQCLVEDSARFDGAVLIGATPGIEDDAERDRRATDDDARADALEQQGVEAFLAEWRRRPIIATQERIEPAHQAAMSAARARHTAHGLANALRGGGTGRMHPLWGRLVEVRCPVLLVTGAEDTKFTAIAARMSTLLPQAQHVVIPEAGHCAHLEQVDATLTEMRRWAAAL